MEGLFLLKIKELPEFSNVVNIAEFENLFKQLYKKRCSKCKRGLLKDNFNCKSNGETFKLCNNCRQIMQNIMRERKLRKNVV